MKKLIFAIAAIILGLVSSQNISASDFVRIDKDVYVKLTFGAVDFDNRGDQPVRIDLEVIGTAYNTTVHEKIGLYLKPHKSVHRTWKYGQYRDVDIYNCSVHYHNGRVSGFDNDKDVTYYMRYHEYTTDQPKSK